MSEPFRKPEHFRVTAKVRGIIANIRVVVRARSKHPEAWAMAVLFDNERIDGIDWHLRFEDHRGQQCEGWHRHVWKPIGINQGGAGRMSVANCHSIKQVLTEHLTPGVVVQGVRDICVATIPFPTIDNRMVDVFFEPAATDYFLIHDGGKGVNELIIQGVKVTDSIHRDFDLLAQRFNISYRDEMFQTGAKLNVLASRAYAVAMCSGVAIIRLLDGERIAEPSPISEQLGVALRRWSRKRAKVAANVAVRGDVKQHTFDFVAPYATQRCHRCDDTESNRRSPFQPPNVSGSRPKTSIVHFQSGKVWPSRLGPRNGAGMPGISLSAFRIG